MTLRMEGGDPATREVLNDIQDRLDGLLATLADSQRRIENLERLAAGSRERVEELSSKIVVQPPSKRKGVFHK